MGPLAAAIVLDEMDEEARPALLFTAGIAEPAEQVHCSSRK